MDEWNWTLGGLPLHPLVVHLTAVAVPTAALVAILVVAWPGLRARLGVISPLIGFVAAAASLLAAESGEALEDVSEETAQLERHTELGDLMTPWAVGLFALMLAWYLWTRRGRTGNKAVTIILAILLVLVAIGTGIWAVLVGHAGAVAVWQA